MPKPGPIALLGLLLTLCPGAEPATAEGSDPDEVRIVEVPVRSGVASFEIPGEQAGRDFFLIVSALSTDGPFEVRYALDPAGIGGGAADFRDLAPVVPLSESIAPATPGGAQPPRDEATAERSSAPARPPLRRAFSVRVRPGDPSSPSRYDLVDARLRALGERIQVFVDDDDVAMVGDEVLRAIVAAFDREIEPRIARRVGRVLDVDRDGRLSVLLSSRIGLPFSDRSHVDGYFRSSDLDDSLPRPLSNRADLIYLDARIAAGPYLETVLAHEYAHAVLDSLRRESRGPIAEESWIDEALTHLCEDIAGRSAMNVDYRASAFLTEPNRYRVIVDDEHRAGSFRSHGNRGASYLFLRWCAETFDPDLPRTLSTRGRVGLPNLERALGLPFETLYRHWTIDLLLGSLGMMDPSPDRLDVLGTLGDWPLGGVRIEELAAGDAPASFSIAGTGCQFVHLLPDPTGPTRVAIRSESGAALQVSAAVLPRSGPRVRLGLSVVGSDPGSPRVVVRAEESAGRRTILERLSWEPAAPSPDRPRAEHRFRSVEGDELRTLFPEGTALGPGDRRASAPLPIDESLLGAGPIVFRLVARTPDGRRSVSWSQLPASDALALRGHPPVTSRRPASDRSAPTP